MFKYLWPKVYGSQDVESSTVRVDELPSGPGGAGWIHQGRQRHRHRTAVL